MTIKPITVSQMSFRQRRFRNFICILINIRTKPNFFHWLENSFVGWFNAKKNLRVPEQRERLGWRHDFKIKSEEINDAGQVVSVCFDSSAEIREESKVRF